MDISEKSGNGIAEFTEKGIKTTDGNEYEFDIIAIATGFDITTGGMTSMGLKSIHGTELGDEWKAAANTYLGTTISGYVSDRLVIPAEGLEADALEAQHVPPVRSTWSHSAIQWTQQCRSARSLDPRRDQDDHPSKAKVHRRD